MCTCVNESDCVVCVRNIIHWAVNANIGGEASAVYALHTTGVMSMPNAGVVGSCAHDSFTVCETEKAHESEGQHWDEMWEGVRGFGPL